MGHLGPVVITILGGELHVVQPVVFVEHAVAGCARRVVATQVESVVGGRVFQTEGEVLGEQEMVGDRGVGVVSVSQVNAESAWRFLEQ